MKLNSKFPPVVQVLFWALAAWVLSTYLPLFQLPFSIPTIAVAATAGLAFLASALADFHKHRTTVNPLEPKGATTLVTGGPYRITRNPMYVGMALLLLSWCLYLAELVGLLAVPLFVTTMTILQIKSEETALVTQFGDQYREYMGRVNRWLLF